MPLADDFFNVSVGKTAAWFTVIPSFCKQILPETRPPPHTKTRENTRVFTATVHGWQVAEMRPPYSPTCCPPVMLAV